MTVRIGILGASGYTGAELIRLVLGHPSFSVAFLTADRRAGERMGSIFPHLAAFDLPDLIRMEDADLGSIDGLFCCLPHATTQDVIRDLPKTLRIVDLSADFRLRDPKLYEDVYGRPHTAIKRQEDAVYGLTELYRGDIRNSTLVANPGCYTTTSELALCPLIAAGVISTEDIVIDAKSGQSGAGRGLKEAMLYSEVAEGFSAYGVTGHRHQQEIEQELSVSAGKTVGITFMPHLVPMNRGILTTCHVKLASGRTVDDARQVLHETYNEERFVQLLDEGVVPHTRHVRGSNFCHIGVFPGQQPGRLTVLSVIDNLMKGASGQALQNMNVMLGLEESLGIAHAPMFP